MQIRNWIRIRKARKKDAISEISLKGYFETNEKLRIRAENVKSIFEVGELIQESCSFTEEVIVHGRKVLKALEVECQKRVGTDNPGSALKLLSFARRYRDYLQEEIENYNILQDMRKSYRRVIFQNAS